MEHLNTTSGAILFSDIKNFTLKSSLLTELQIRNILNKQDEIINPLIKKHKGKIIKSMGDSYMIFFKKALDSIKFSTQLQKKLDKYNKNIKLNLFSIELRISIDFGKLEKEKNINGEDYFGETVNISSRLNNITPENKIFVTKNLIEEIKHEESIHYTFLGETKFKGILYKTEIYNILYKIKDINLLKKKLYKESNINDFILTNNYKEKIEDIDSSIFKFSSVAAILGIQPVPFLDTYSAVPLHMYMLKEISKSYGIKLSIEESREILTTLISSIGSNYAISQGVIGISKIGLIGFGGYIMIPLNFALTYAMGKILSYYFYKKTQGLKATNSELKELFKYSVKSGKNIAKKEKDEIIKTGHQYKNIITEKITDISGKSESKVKNIINKIKKH